MSDTIETLLYVSPGFIAVWVFRWFVPQRKPGEFEWLLYSIISGLPITLGARGLTLLLVLPLPRGWFTQFLVGTEGSVIAAWILAVPLGRLGAVGYGRYRDRQHKRSMSQEATESPVRMLHPSVWSAVVDYHRQKEGPFPLVRVVLTSGDAYVGCVYYHSPVPDEGQSDIFLLPASRVKKQEEESPPGTLDLHVVGEVPEGVYVPSSSIAQIEFFLGPMELRPGGRP